ncbi:MAG: phosphatidylglycerophosphate synthase [Candidatus Promineifilaceae bacterium]|jgi:phosphatidylglycerophosphate synthase
MTSQMASIYRWTRLHAFIIFTLFIVAIVQKSAVLVSIGGLLSFAFYIFQHPTSETAQGAQSFWRIPANYITLVRVTIVSVIGLSHQLHHPITVGLIGVAILITDYFDGYLSKKHNTASLFGAQFDQEGDAFYIGIYSLLLYINGYAGVWVLTLGLLRYFNVIALYLLNQQHKKEARFKGARIVAVIVMIALLVPYILPPFLYIPYLIISVISLIFSFGYTFIAQIMQPQ